MKMKVSTESLATAGITGGAAVAIVLSCVLFVLCFSLCIFALAGLVTAYGWNEFVVPNVDADLPTLVWWQAGAILICLRMLFGLIMPSRSS